jgi:2'-5' RNA ligase
MTTSPRPALGSPSERSAVIIRAKLPRGLDRLRRVGAFDAAAGVPAHLTLLYPFVAPERLDCSVRRTLAAVAASHPAFDYSLTGQATWPDTVYVAVDPVEPFVRLQVALAQAFPAFPIYGRDAGFEFVPHVTITEGKAVGEATLREGRAWAALPRHARATHLEVIARGVSGQWRTAWRLRLDGPTRGRRRAGGSRR